MRPVRQPFGGGVASAVPPGTSYTPPISGSPPDPDDPDPPALKAPAQLEQAAASQPRAAKPTGISRLRWNGCNTD